MLTLNIMIIYFFQFNVSSTKITICVSAEGMLKFWLSALRAEI